MGGSNLFTGTLDILILRAVAPGPLHGYAVGRWIRQQSRDVLNIEEGVLYPALHRLTRRGFLKPKWGQTETGRRARFYSITHAGREQLEAERSRWLEYSKAVSAVLVSMEG
jgi:PadR family transcriptional regulator PadR